jgi:hypothetical protein
MGKDLHTIDHLFRTAQKDFEEEPSSAVWEKITCKLDHNPGDTKSKDKLFFGWRKILLLFVFVLIAFGLDRYKINNQVPLIGKASLVEKPAKENGIEISGSQEELPVPANFPDKIFRKKSEARQAQPKSVKKPGKRYFVSRNGLQKKSSLIPAPGSLLIASDIFPDKSKITISDAVAADDGMNVPIYTTVNMDMNNPKENILTNAKLLENRTGFSVPAYGKNELSVRNKKKWALSVLAMNDWGGYFINDEKLDRSGIPHDENDEISGREHHEESFSVSAFLSRYFTDKFMVKGGVTYSSTAIGINPQFIYASKDPSGTLGYKYVTSSGYDFVKPSFGSPLTIGDSLYSSEAKQKLETISLQVMPGYTFRKNKLSITPAAGVLVGYIGRATLKTEVEDNSNREVIFVSKLAGSRKFYAGIVTDISLAYKFTKKWSLLFVPAFRINISPVTTTDFIKTYPYSFSIGAGMSYSF